MTYDYQCTNCGYVFEITQGIKDPVKTKPDKPCSKCNKIAPITRLISGGAAVLFKGAGFFQTDYRSESYKKGEKAEKAIGKSPPPSKNTE